MKAHGYEEELQQMLQTFLKSVYYWIKICTNGQRKICRIIS